MLLISWNIDSLNAALTGTSTRAGETRQVLHKLAGMKPDVLAIQETKLRATGPTKKHQQVLQAIFPDYDYAWRSSVEPARKGYAGTMFLYKQALQPTITKPKVGAPAPMDDEGRIITLELPSVYISQVYTPNSGTGLRRLADRQKWDQAYRRYLQELDEKKPVIVSGDFNAAYREIDLAHPENNHHSAGFTDEERADFGQLLKAGFTDTFRKVHGDVTGAYSWWAQRVRTAKANNSGWRLDYYLVSNRLADQVVKAGMVDTGKRRDHCPVMLEIKLK